ncbi:MAG: D-glycero-beta-D-manno-heptose 1,7-bisphosphate 7-phosphatase [Candidatus Omnitrophota bacterium]|nr:D-glycero-beta-D-manno-heptose 1,7-bisphosphate 7-phosphatase [Candidatus Omnitrophota bacterium]
MRAVFLDRDGVINFPPSAKRYITRWEEFRFLPGVLDSVKKLSSSRRKIILVSNQAGVERGVFSKANLKEITRKMLHAIESRGGRIDAVYYCTHIPERHCRCRKPRAGMLRKAARRFSLDLRRSVVVGDNATDIKMGQSAGCRAVLVLTGMTGRTAAKKISPPPDFIARDLSAATRWILKRKAA